MPKFLPLTLTTLSALLGLVTIIAGTRVLGGADPGYTVFYPLLYFNTGMGAVYIASGVAGAIRPSWGLRTAGVITFANLIALGLIEVLFASTDNITAIESVIAMTFRTGVWAALWWGWGRVEAGHIAKDRSILPQADSLS